MRSSICKSMIMTVLSGLLLLMSIAGCEGEAPPPAARAATTAPSTPPPTAVDVLDAIPLGSSFTDANRVMIEDRGAQFLRTAAEARYAIEVHSYIDSDTQGQITWCRLHFVDRRLFMTESLLFNPQRSVDGAAGQYQQLHKQLQSQHGPADLAVGAIAREAIERGDDIVRQWQVRDQDTGLTQQLTLEVLKEDGGPGGSWPVVHLTQVNVQGLEAADREMNQHLAAHPQSVPRALEGWRVRQRLPVAAIDNPYRMRLFLIRLQERLSAGDRDALVDMVHLPFSVYEKGTRIRRFETRESLRASFEQLFTERVRRAIRQASFEHLFVNYKGVMIGRGEIWMGRGAHGVHIVAINGTAFQAGAD